MGFVNRFSRDNSRTPMQWDSSNNAGFTAGKPWIHLNENYTQINVAAEENAPDSTLNWFRNLIKFRSNSTDLLEGAFEAILEGHKQLMAYRRGHNITVVINLSEEPVVLSDKELAELGEKNILVSNYDGFSTSENRQKMCKSQIRPLEALILN